MRVSRSIAFLAACIILALFTGCGDDSTVEPDAEDPLQDRPAIPEPTYYAGPVPEKSLEFIVKTVELSNYVASVDSIWLHEGWCCDGPGCDFACKFYPTYPGPNRMRLVDADTVVTEVDSLMTMVADPNSTWQGLMASQPLSSVPYIQHVRYWIRLGVVERYSGSTSVTVTRSTTRGIERTKAEEFGMSIGMETSASGGFFVDFSVTLRTEFSYSSSTSLSISEEETVEESFTITCPDNQNIVYCVWQLVDEFRILGVDGEEFTDPYFYFTEGIHTAICPTNEFVPMTTYFDNP